MRKKYVITQVKYNFYEVREKDTNIVAKVFSKRTTAMKWIRNNKAAEV